MAKENVNEPAEAAGGEAAPALRIVTAGVVPDSRFREAYDRTLPETAALADKEVLIVNIDVPSAVATTIGVLPQILEYRDDAAGLPRFDIGHFDRLEQLTFALVYAHARLTATPPPSDPFAHLNEHAVRLRNTMYHDAVALAYRGLISAERLSEFKANVGYKGLAANLLGLAHLLRSNWDRIASKTALQLGELQSAERLAAQLAAALGSREQLTLNLAQVSAQRQRNFTLFARSYNQTRRAIGFLRWDYGDADQICPSLYAGRGGSRRKQALLALTPVPDSHATVEPVTTPPAAR